MDDIYLKLNKSGRSMISGTRVTRPRGEGGEMQPISAKSFISFKEFRMKREPYRDSFFLGKEMAV